MPPKEQSLIQIRDIIGRKAFSELLNTFESEFIDFKSEPYQLEEESQKVELAKDISSFANTFGGFILLGIKTKKFEEYKLDVADELRPIPSNRINLEQYESIARDWIYPPISGLRVQLIPSPDDLQKVFVVLEIPESTIVDKPFLIVRSSEDSRGRNKRITFGYAERFRGSSQPLIVQRIQQLLHLGRRLETHDSFHQAVHARLGNLEAQQKRLEATLLQQVEVEVAAVKEKRGEKFDQNFQLAAKDAELEDQPHLMLGAIPEPGISLDSLFATSQNPLVRAFENPPEFREGGFDFALHRPSEIIKGTIRRVSIPGFHLMQLSTAGELIVLVPGDEGFLAWALNTNIDRPIRINSFVLAEVIYAFSVYVRNIYSSLPQKPQALEMYVGLRNMTRNGSPALLSSDEARRFGTGSTLNFKSAPSPSCIFSVLVPVDETAERTAFLVRSKIYHWFGFDDGSVPYATTDSEGRKVVTEQSVLKNVGKDN